MNTSPGQGERWEQLAQWLRAKIPVAEVDGIWVFRVVRHEKAEYGTAVLSLVAGDRRRILTARYVATIKGRERGGWEAKIAEVGSGPLEALEELLALVPIRADDEESPSPVEPALWFYPLAESEESAEPGEQVGEDGEETSAAEPALEGESASAGS